MSIKETLDAKLVEENGTRLLNQYLISQQLGQGSFGSVYLAYDNDYKRYVAIKECSKSKLRKQKLMSSGGRGRGRGRGTMKRVTISRPHVVATNPLDLVRTEIAILKKLDHPNVVKLYEVLDDPTHDSLFMVFELCEKGCILDLNMRGQVTPLSIESTRHYFQQLVLGIEYLHEHEIAHRDIKPDNMMISANGELKIVDFGVSEMFSKGNAAFDKTAGSPAFYPPECCGCNTFLFSK
jgi:serine/threonine protein kinase